MKALLNYRYYVVFVLTTLGVVLLIAEPSEDMKLLVYTLLKIATLVGSAVAFAVAYKLYKHWTRRGEMRRQSELLGGLFAEEEEGYSN